MAASGTVQCHTLGPDVTNGRDGLLTRGADQTGLAGELGTKHLLHGAEYRDARVALR